MENLKLPGGLLTFARLIKKAGLSRVSRYNAYIAWLIRERHYQVYLHKVIERRALCPHCGADKINWMLTFGERHKCKKPSHTTALH